MALCKLQLGKPPKGSVSRLQGSVTPESEGQGLQDAPQRGKAAV